MLPAFILILALAGPSWAGESFKAVVLRVTDGDTIVVRTDDFEDIKVRLYGIDAPESKQEGGAEATAALKVIQGRRVTIIEMARDRYGRLVALVSGKWLIQLMPVVPQERRYERR